MLKFNSKDHVITNATLTKQIARQEKNKVLKQLYATVDGLNPVQTKQRLGQDGLSEISSKERHPKLHFLIDAFMTPSTGVLLPLTGLSLLTNYVFVLADRKDLSTVTIMTTTVLVSGIISLIQNARTSDTVDSLLNMVSVTMNVKRIGEDKESPTKNIAVGDTINLTVGDPVPTGMYLLKSKDLFCSANSLNGESNPAEKMADQKPKESDSYLDYPNILYEGINTASGSGVGVVSATGDKTVFGNLARTFAQNKSKETTSDIGIKNVSRISLIMTAVTAPLVFLINGLTKGDWLNASIFAIVTAVDLMPEMLPVIVVSSPVRGSIEIAKYETIIKRVNSIQNFGSADILCTNKTDTLAQDKVVLEQHYNSNLEEGSKVLELPYLNSYYQTGMKDLINKAVVDTA